MSLVSRQGTTHATQPCRMHSYKQGMDVMLTEAPSGALITGTVGKPRGRFDWRQYIPTRSRIAPSSLHYWITLVLAVSFLPLATVTRLTFAPPIYLLALFAKVAFSSVILAAILHLIDTPLSTTIDSFRARPGRLLMPAVMGCAFAGVLGWSTGLSLTAASFIVIE